MKTYVVKRCKRRLFSKQVNRSVRVHNRDWKRWYDRHTRWIEYAIAERLCPTDEECPF